MVSWRSRGGIGPCGEAPGKGSRSSASECEVVQGRVFPAAAPRFEALNF